jgi:transposase-like protein
MELEVGHGETEVYAGVQAWGRAPDQGSRRVVCAGIAGFELHPSQLRDWVKKFSEDPQHAFPGHGQMKPEQLEIVHLKHEVAKLKAERDTLKKAAAYFAKEAT